MNVPLKAGLYKSFFLKRFHVHRVATDQREQPLQLVYCGLTRNVSSAY